jgi:transcriptional regulator with XRE-family HTH domain
MGATLGQRLRTLRGERGLSQAELAGDLVSPSYVSLIEAGKRVPERDVLEGLAQRLGCSTQFLESGVPPEEMTQQRLRLQFAEIALASGAAQDAHDAFTELASAANSEIRTAALWGLARAQEALGDLHSALTGLEELLRASRANELGAPGIITVRMAMCRVYKLAGDFSRSIEVGEAGLGEVRELGLEGCEEEIKLASTVVASYWARGDLFSAQHLASQVIDRAEKLGSRTAIGSAYWNASIVAAQRGQLVLALDLATRTMALLAESSPDASLAAMRITYAWLLLRDSPPRVDEADSALGRAYTVLLDVGLSQFIASCETEMARSALLRGELDAAVEIADRAVSRLEGGSNPEVAQARAVRGLALILMGDVQAGIEAVSASAQLLEVLGARREAAEAWRELGEALVQRGRSDEAIQALRRAADCAGARTASIRPSVASVSHPV